MAEKDVFEETMINITATVKRGSGERSTAKFIFTKSGGEGGDIPPHEAEFDPKEAKSKTDKPIKVEVTAPKVLEGEDKYDISYETQVGKPPKATTTSGQDLYHVWPKQIKINGTKDSACTLEIDHVPYVISSVGSGTSIEQMAKNGLSLDVTLPEPGEYRIETRSPWEITWTKKAGRTQDVKVSVKPWKAKIYSPAEGKAEDDPLRPTVNAAGANPSLLKVDVGPATLSLGLKGQKIKVRVTFPKENSKRKDPFPAMWLTNNISSKVALKSGTAPGVDDLKYETELTLPSDGGKATFYVQLGYAGGDKCKVEVGVTDSYGDDTLWVENWREIGLELFVGGATLRQKCTKILADSGAALGTDLKTELDRIFEKTFIKFSFPTGSCVALEEADFKQYLKGNGTGFTYGDIDAPANLFVPAAKFVTKDYNASTNSYDKITYSNGDKLFLLSDYQQRLVRQNKISTVRPKNTMTWVFCDYIADRSSRNLVGPSPEFRTDMSTVKNFYVTNFETPAEKTVELPFHVFEFDPIEASGSFGINGVHWRATHWRKKGDTPWTAVKVGLPGYANRAFIKVDFTTVELRNKWTEIVDSMNVKLKLPADADTDPGKVCKGKMTVTGAALDSSLEGVAALETVELEYELKIQTQFEFYGISFGTLGGAVGGSGQLRTGGGRVTVLGMAQTLAHEIGHNMGQTYTAEVTGEVGGCTEAEIDGVPFEKKFPAGNYYVGKGHQGSHCAKALLEVMASAPETDKTAIGALTYNFTSPEAQHKTDYFDKVKQKDQCVMYGDGPEMATESMDFCETCKGFLRAVDLRDVSKSW